MYRFAPLLALVTAATTNAATVSVPGTWSLVQQGYVAYLLDRQLQSDILRSCRTTGVSAMQLSIVNPTKAIIFDKVEHNPLKRANGLLAWAVE
jgi:hypothetical protein